MRDGTERAAKTRNLIMWIQRVGVECIAQAKGPGQRPGYFPGVLGVEIEIEEAEWLICCQRKSPGCGRRHSIDELRQRRVSHGRNCALTEVIVIQAKDSGVRSKPEFVSAMAPGEVIVDEEARSSPALNPGIVESADGSEWCICTAALQHNRKCRERLLKVTGPKQALVPGKRGIEVVHQILRKDVGVSRRERIERLRRDRVEQRVDGIGIGSLYARVSLKAEPCRVCSD